MRFLHDVALRWSIVVILAGGTVIGSIQRTATAQSSAAQSAAAQPTAGQPTATQRLPKPAAPAAGARPAAQKAAPAAGNRPATQPGASQAAGPRVATSAGQAGPNTAAPAAGAPPFQLNSREQELLDKTLAQWETKNSATKKFKCEFKRYEYDSTLKGTKAEDNRRSTSTGEVKYKQPDHGMFRVIEKSEFNENKQEYEEKTDGLDHWVCDGKAIYEFVPTDKKLKVHPLPEEMRGEAIADGPIPFIFGAKADKMKQRYWLRDVTKPDEIGKHIWLEAFPKYQHDAANFSSALLLLNPDFTIYGLQITSPGDSQRTAFIFSGVVINDPLSIIKGDFASPTTPWGWTKEVDPPPADPGQPDPKQPAATAATTSAAAAAPTTARQPKPAAPATPAKR